MTRSSGIAEFEATLILVVVSLALASLVYGAVGRFSAGNEETYSAAFFDVGGSPDILLLRVNASSQSSMRVLQADGAASEEGILFLGDRGYGSSHALCSPSATTFFSVYAPAPSELRVASDGRSWVGGSWTNSASLRPGWNEVMISDASSCSLSVGGTAISYPGPAISSVPLQGSLNGTAFELFVPTNGTPHSLLIVFDGGTCRVET